MLLDRWICFRKLGTGTGSYLFCMLICSNLLQVVDCSKWCSDACICDIFCSQLNCGLSYVLTGLGTCWCFEEKGDRCWKGTCSALCQGWILYVPKFYTLLSPAWRFSIILPEYALPAIRWNLTWFKHPDSYPSYSGFDSKKNFLMFCTLNVFQSPLNLLSFGILHICYTRDGWW